MLVAFAPVSSAVPETVIDEDVVVELSSGALMTTDGGVVSGGGVWEMSPLIVPPLMLRLLAMTWPRTTDVPVRLTAAFGARSRPVNWLALLSEKVLPRQLTTTSPGSVFSPAVNEPELMVTDGATLIVTLDRKSTRLNSSHEWISRM